MALSLKDPETDRLARALAALAGETLTEAIGKASAKRRERERVRRGHPGWPAGFARSASNARAARHGLTCDGCTARAWCRKDVALIVVDGSVLLAVLLKTQDAARFDAALASAPLHLISAVARVGGCLRHREPQRPARPDGPGTAAAQGHLETAAVTPQQADLAADAFRRFGIGPQSAALTLGGCFAYALTQTVGLPLLFRDERFRQTDITAVLPPA